MSRSLAALQAVLQGLEVVVRSDVAPLPSFEHNLLTKACAPVRTRAH